MTEEPYPWVRRSTERGKAYEAFRAYLNLGPGRTIREAGEEVGISINSAQELSTRHDWVARSIAYDQHLASAATDGLASQMASARDENLALADEMRGLAVDLLRRYAEVTELPPAHFSQFVLAFVNVEKHAFLMKDDPKASAAREKVQGLLERFNRASQT